MSRQVWKYSLFGCVLCLALTSPKTRADEAKPDAKPIQPETVDLGRPVDFEKDIFPILDANCIACHNLGIKENNLNLEDVPNILKGGKRGPSVVAKEPDKSLLYKVAARSVQPAMPPLPNKVEANALTPKELGLLRQWIVEGAAASAGGTSATVQWQPLPSGIRSIYSVAVSADGQYVACGRANRILIYYAPTGALVAQLTDPNLVPLEYHGKRMYGDHPAHRDFVHSLAFSPDGLTLASGDYRTVKLWTRPAAVERMDLAAAGGTALAISPDQKWFATGSADNQVRIWSLADGKPAKTLGGHTAPVTALRFSPDGARLCTSSLDKSIRIWDIAAGTVIGRIDTLAGVNGIAVNPEATQIVSAGTDNVVRAWNVPSAAPRLLRATAAATPALVVSPDRKLAAIAGTDGTIELVDLANGQLAKTLSGHSGPVLSVAFSANSPRLASGGADKTIRVWDVSSGQSLKTVSGGLEAVAAVALDATGNQLAAGTTDGKLRSWKLDGPADRPLNAETVDKNFPPHAKAVTAVIYGKTGDALFSGSEDGTVRRCSTADGLQQFAASHGAAVVDIDLSLDGNLLASAGEDKQIHLWNTANIAPGPKPVLAGFDSSIRSVSFSLDNQRVIGGGANGEIRAYNVTSGLVEQAFAEHAGAVTALATAGEKGDLVVSASADKTIRVWPLVAGMQFSGHAKPVTSVAYVLPPNGQVVSGSEDGTVRVWNLADGAQVRSLDLGGPVSAVAVRPDGQQIAAAGANNIARLWNAADGKQIAEMRGDLRAQRQVANLTTDEAEAKGAVTAAANAIKAGETDSTAKTDAAKKTAEAKKTADGAIAAPTAKVKEATDKLAAAKTAADAKTDDQNLAKAKADAEKALADANAELKKATDAKASADKAAEQADKAVKEASDVLTKAKTTSEAAIAQQKNAEMALGAGKSAATQLERPMRSIAFSADGKLLATGGDDRLVHTWNAADGSPLELYGGQQSSVSAVAFTADNRLIALATDQHARIWEMNPAWSFAAQLGPKSDAPLELGPSPFVNRVLALAFNHAGTLLATGGGDPSRSGELMIWDVAKRTLVRNIEDAHSDTVFGVEFSYDDKYLLSGAADKFVKIYDVATGKHVRSFEGHTHHVLGVTWKTDGKVIASSGADNVIKVWNVETGEQQRTIQGYLKQVTAIHFMGRGKNFVSSGGDGNVRFHQFDNGSNIRSFSGAKDFVYTVAASADEKVVAAGGEDGVLRIWNGTNGQALHNFDPPKTPAEEAADAKTRAAAQK